MNRRDAILATAGGLAAFSLSAIAAPPPPPGGHAATPPPPAGGVHPPPPTTAAPQQPHLNPYATPQPTAGQPTGAAMPSGYAPAQPVAPQPITNGPAVVKAATDCVAAGQACLENCMRILSGGDKSMAECAYTVRQMMPVCEAMAQLARMGSLQAKALAAVCARVCRDCEATCKVHAAHHAECKACMDACAKCAVECEKAAA